MNGELNFSISPEGLTEKGEEIRKQGKIIKDALSDVNDARSSLASWISTNKDRYDSQIAKSLPKMNEMVEVIDSYSKVAVQTSTLATETENKIAKAIDDTFVA